MRYFVEEGKSLTTTRGIKGEHLEITKKDLGGGDNVPKRLEELKDLGYLYTGEVNRTEAKKRAEVKLEEAKKLAKVKSLNGAQKSNQNPSNGAQKSK